MNVWLENQGGRRCGEVMPSFSALKQRWLHSGSELVAWSDS